MTRARLSLASLCLLAIVITACSSGSAAPTAAGPGATGAGGVPTQAAGNGGNTGGTLPCAAIQADVVAAAGKTLATTDFTKPTECEYNFGGSADLAGIDGVVDVRMDNDSDLSGDKLAFPKGEDVSGLGDAAYFSDGVSVMWAQFHGRTYAVQLVLFGSDADAKGITTRIMQSLLSHL